MEMWCAGFFQTTVKMYKSARAKTHHCQQRTNQTPILHAIGKGWFRHIASPFLLDCWQENCWQESSNSYWYYSTSVKRMLRSEGMSMSFDIDIVCLTLARKGEGVFVCTFQLLPQAERCTGRNSPVRFWVPATLLRAAVFSGRGYQRPARPAAPDLRTPPARRSARRRGAAP